MSETEIPAAIAQQEEYLRRRRPCREVRFRSHRFVASRLGDWSVCAVCGVTETDADYQRKVRYNESSGKPR